MSNKKPTLTFIKQEVRRMDKDLTETESAFRTAVIMLAALSVGQNINKLAAFTKLPKEFVRERAAALRANGIWQNGKTNAEWFEENGGIAFWMDVACAEGLLQRTKAA